jgi:hypothetical protein
MYNPSRLLADLGSSKRKLVELLHVSALLHWPSLPIRINKRIRIKEEEASTRSLVCNHWHFFLGLLDFAAD